MVRAKSTVNALHRPLSCQRIARAASLPSAVFACLLSCESNSGSQDLGSDVKSHLEPLIRTRDGATMALVPAGEFEMGPRGSRAFVFLDDFYVDTHEVTNARYRRFVEETGHRPSPEWNDPSLSQPRQPVIGLAWADADAYCRWAGKRLPTEAEWEKAARGDLVGKAYPWGDEPPSPAGPYRANFDTGPAGDADGFPKTAPVGSFAPNGYGLFDTAGNAWEWCADRHEPQRGDEPLLGWVGEGEHRILRGGGWLIASYMPEDQYLADLRVDFRMAYNAQAEDWNIGCRCASDRSLSAAPASE